MFLLYIEKIKYTHIHTYIHTYIYTLVTHSHVLFVKIGTYDTVTFTEVDSMPTFLRHQNPPTIPEKLCKITGQLAKYRDPVTGFPYANIEALREIKRKFHKMES